MFLPQSISTDFEKDDYRAKTKFRGFTPQANCTDQATAACRRS
jgi:hypothetical protein